MSLRIFSAIPSDARGPAATTVYSFVSIWVTSSSITEILGCDFIFSVTIFANASRSTARAPPAGTFTASAHSIIRELSFRISSFSNPTALYIPSARKELLQTSSAKSGLLWAGENFLGFISYKSTKIPILASCHAASQPASPAPITFIFFLSDIRLLPPKFILGLVYHT